jgi:hypothetical protein
MADQPEQIECAVSVRRMDDTLREVGRVAFAERGQLMLLSALPDYRALLERILEAVNGQETLTIKVPPPAGEEPGSVFSATVRRNDPKLLDAVQDHLEQQYDLHLVRILTS